MEQSRDFGRIWRRVVGLGAFVLFLCGLLVAIDLEELVVIAGALGALCGLAGVLTWALVHFRRTLVGGVATAGRVTAPQVVRVSRRTGSESRRLGAASVRGSRRAGLAAAVAGAEVARVTRSGARRAVPVFRRADEQLGIRVRAFAAAGRRHTLRALNVIAADIHAHRDAIRASSPRAGEAVRPSGRNPGDRRPGATRSAEAQRRGRA